MSPPDIKNVVNLFRNGDIEEAASQCEAFLQHYPEHGRALLLMSAIEHRLARPESALACLQKAAQAFGTDSNGVLDTAVAMQRIGALEEAGDLLDAMDANQPLVSDLIAQNEWLLGNYRTALEQFRLSVTRWPDTVNTYHGCIRALLRLGQRDEAGRILNDGLVRFPEDNLLQRLKIACLLDQREADESLRHSRMMTGVNSDTALLQAALESVFSDSSFKYPSPPNQSRTEAIVNSHRWLLRQQTSPVWFGTGTGLLEWATGQAPESGLIVECGVFHGMSINLMAGWSSREIHGFDSFQGLPEDWKANEPAGSYSTRGKLPEVPEHVVLHAGWFEQTLPEFSATLKSPINLLHIDCDLYSSAQTVLRHLGPHLSSGSILVFDDFLAYPGYEDHEFRAAMEHFELSPGKFSLSAAVVLGRSVAFQVK